EADDGDRPGPGADDYAGGAVDERGPPERREARTAREHLTRNRLGAFDRRPRERAVRAHVDPEDDVGVEHGEQRLEVAGARSGEERVDEAALPREIGVRRRGAALHASARPARELP